MKGRRELDIREQLVSTTGPLSTSPIFSNKAIMVSLIEGKIIGKRIKWVRVKTRQCLTSKCHHFSSSQPQNRNRKRSSCHKFNSINKTYLSYWLPFFSCCPLRATVALLTYSGGIQQSSTVLCFVLDRLLYVPSALIHQGFCALGQKIQYHTYSNTLFS